MKAILAILFALLAIVSAGVKANTEKIQIKQLKAQIFDRHGTSLGVDTTVDLCEKRKDHDQLKYQVHQMVMLRSMARFKCTLRSLNELKSIINSNLDYKSNLLPYLQQGRFNYCQGIIGKEVESAVADLSEENKNHLELLFEEVGKASEIMYESDEVSKIKRSPTVEDVILE